MPFAEVIGHRQILGLLSRAVARDTLPPSLIFAGPEGVGKRRTAVALAQALNCSEREIPGGDACGECASCRRIARGVHADVLLIEPGETGSIKIDQVREAIERSGYRPFEGRRRVVIVDDADTLVAEAQNALLKVLEEPPPASQFVLVTARPDLLLPTVRSRCPRLRFGRLSVAEIADALVRAHGYAEREARAAATAADGSLGQALRQRSGELGEAREVALTVLRELAPSPDPRRRLACAKELVAKGDAGTVDGARPGPFDKLRPGAQATERDEVVVRLRSLAALLRDVEVYSTSADERWLANADLKSRLESLAKAYASDRLLRAFTAVDRALGALEDRNASPKIVADWLVFQI